MLGREISRIVDEKLQVGTYEFNFDASNLPSGTYFYRISVSTNERDNWTQTRKMVLIK